MRYALVWSRHPADSWRKGRRWILINLQPADTRTLQFGPLWVLSALAGTYNRFQSYELAAFWDTLVAVALRTPRPAREILTSMAEDRSGLLLDFELDDRPVVSGLRQIWKSSTEWSQRHPATFGWRCSGLEPRSLVIAVRMAGPSLQNTSSSCCCWRSCWGWIPSRISAAWSFESNLTDMAGRQAFPGAVGYR